MKENITYNLETKKYKFSFFNELHNCIYDNEFDDIDTLLKFKNQIHANTNLFSDIVDFLNINKYTEETFNSLLNLLRKFKQILDDDHTHIIWFSNKIYSDPQALLDFLHNEDRISIMYNESENVVEILKYIMFNFKFIPYSVSNDLLYIIINNLETKNLFEVMHIYYKDPKYFPHSIDIKYLFNKILEYKYENFTKNGLPVPDHIKEICDIL